MVQLQNAHTGICPYLPSLPYLDLPSYWTAQGSVVIRTTASLQRDDLVVELGGLTASQLLSELSKVATAAKNEHWLKIMGIPLMANLLFLEQGLIRIITPEVNGIYF